MKQIQAHGVLTFVSQSSSFLVTSPAWITNKQEHYAFKTKTRICS